MNNLPLNSSINNTLDRNYTLAPFINPSLNRNPRYTLEPQVSNLLNTQNSFRNITNPQNYSLDSNNSANNNQANNTSNSNYNSENSNSQGNNNE